MPVSAHVTFSSQYLIRSFSLYRLKPKSCFSPPSICYPCHDGNSILPVPQAGNLGRVLHRHFVCTTHPTQEQTLLDPVLKYVPVPMFLIISALVQATTLSRLDCSQSLLTCSPAFSPCTLPFFSHGSELSSGFLIYPE